MTLPRQELIELLSSIGNRLREHREAQGLTIGNVASFTRINPRTLEAIEEGNLEALPAMVFVRGFIRNYFQVLSLKDTGLQEDLVRLEVQRPTDENEISHTPPNLLGEPSRPLPWGQLILGLMAVMLVAWVGYLIYQVATDSPQIVETPAIPAPETPSAQQPPEPADPVQQGAPPKEAPPEPAATAVTGAKKRPGTDLLSLTLQGRERTWVRVRIDDEAPEDVLLDLADSLSWEARETIELTIGKSQGIHVILEGEEISLPGQADQLLTGILLTRQTLLLLQN